LSLSLIRHQGNFLADSKHVETVVCTEFKLTPLEGARGSNIPFNIDGDPVDACPIHVRVLHRRLRVFCLEPVNNETLSPIRRRSRGEVVIEQPEESTT
jgi:diacylglycerol kinase family enzyme